MTGEIYSELERENSEVVCIRRKKKSGPEVRETLVIVFVSWSQHKMCAGSVEFYNCCSSSNGPKQAAFPVVTHLKSNFTLAADILLGVDLRWR